MGPCTGVHGPKHIFYAPVALSPPSGVGRCSKSASRHTLWPGASAVPPVPLSMHQNPLEEMTGFFSLSARCGPEEAHLLHCPLAGGVAVAQKRARVCDFWRSGTPTPHAGKSNLFLRPIKWLGGGPGSTCRLAASSDEPLKRMACQRGRSRTLVPAALAWYLGLREAPRT